MVPFVMLGDEVTRGRLIAPLGFDPDDTEYGLIAPRTATEPVGFSALCDWLGAAGCRRHDRPFLRMICLCPAHDHSEKPRKVGIAGGRTACGIEG